MQTRPRPFVLLFALFGAAACHRDEQRASAPPSAVRLRADSVFTDDDPATRKSCGADADCRSGELCHPGHGRCFTSYPSPRMLEASYKLEDCQLTNVYFPFDSTDLGAEAGRWLEYDARCLKVRNAGRVVIEAHADAQGASGYNLELSRRRGLAVKQQLQRLGLPEDLMEVVPRGERDPLTHGKSEREQAWNRRVELHVK